MLLLARPGGLFQTEDPGVEGKQWQWKFGGHNELQLKADFTIKMTVTL